ncbi:MAG: gliding motility-associated C-terminal domain-containing protein [Saprospiraceae bacterium]|nr:gliding motility-associated C-terminal domain-containing protein [Saprospiraceae bacterium]
MSKNYIFRLFSLLFGLLAAAPLWATHNRAGEIIVEQVGDCTSSLTVKATIITYTKASSVQADRDTLTICWGYGQQCERVARSNGGGVPPQGVVLENDVKFNTYVAFHTYPGRSTYEITMTDPLRNAGILNVNFPNSDQIKFHLSTTYTFLNPQFQGCNNTPRLLQPPVDIGCVGKPFRHNPNAYDADNDSLSYHFTVPRQDVGELVPNYRFPNEINPGPNNSLTINSQTGDILWNSPQRAGEYNLAILIISYRNGVPLDTILRDMQILIVECDNLPPVVETSIDEICVIAGQILEIPVRATAPISEINQLVRLTALGGPFEVSVSPAEFLPDNNTFQTQPVDKVFRWQTACEHISRQYYSVVFKATDNFLGDTTGLATLKTVRIKVTGPPPEGMAVTSGQGVAEVTWDKPYVCDNAEDNYFRGFTIWRREGSNIFPPDTCNPGLEGRGYQKLTQTPFQTEQDGRYYYRDETVERGRTYCYRVLAEFAKTTPAGQYVYNRVESMPSAEVCVQLSRDIPLITHVDVQTTDDLNGQMEVCWSKPVAGDLDTLLNPGPYRYEVLRADGTTTNPNDFSATGINFISPTFAGANDTCFVDNGLNTRNSSYSYRIRFYTGASAEPLGATEPASSVFLTIAPTDNANQLTWNEAVPWDNYQYAIFRKNALGVFDSIATVTTSAYRDAGLVNGEEYCYYIRSEGTYGVSGLASPLFNRSQEVCAVPVDNVPPCATTLSVANPCADNFNCADEESLFNTLTWVNPAQLCAEADDVAGYHIYYAAEENGNFTRIETIDRANTLRFEHKPERGLAGCYAVTALDSVGNESVFSNIVCVDNCPTYLLPNTFTPNGDGSNDLFKPRAICFIERVEFQVYNRWGQLVFQTTDPQLLWDGTNAQGKELAVGAYYYTCRVFEQRVGGVIPRPELLSGWIELVR